MKSKIQAIINSDLEDLLIQTNQLEPLLDGRIKCCICNRTITMENIGGFFDLPLAWSSDEISALIGASKNGVANTQSVVFQYRRNRYTISNNGNIEKKLKAISGERKWYGAFLRQIPKDDMDKLYRAEILSRMNNHYQKKIGMNISGSLKSQGRCTIVKWFFNRNKYGITNKSLIFALLQSFK